MLSVDDQKMVTYCTSRRVQVYFVKSVCTKLSKLNDFHSCKWHFLFDSCLQASVLHKRHQDQDGRAKTERCLFSENRVFNIPLGS